MDVTAKLAPVLFSSLLTLAGCAGTDAQPAGSPAPGSGTQQDRASLLFLYRQEAADLREMAKRRQMEADVLARKVGANDEQVVRKRELAQDLLQAAEEADQKARALQQQMPHGVVQ